MSASSRHRLSFQGAGEDINRPQSNICALCRSRHGHMSQVHTWKNVQACEFVAKKGISKESQICCPCRDDICRCVSNPNYTPRWEKRSKHVQCCVKRCNEYAFVMSKMGDAVVMKALWKGVDFIARKTPFWFQLHYVCNITRPFTS